MHRNDSAGNELSLLAIFFCGSAGTAGNEKGQSEDWPLPIDSVGRGERIRTSDPMHPMHVRYQAALRPD